MGTELETRQMEERNGPLCHKGGGWIQVTLHQCAGIMVNPKLWFQLSLYILYLRASLARV